MRFSKKVCLGIVVGMMATGTALANPFDDVPRDHWAYDAVQTLAKDGVIDGYGDNTFRGDKPITRYEMAQLVGRAVSRERLGTAEDKALIEKLSKEYADELNSMGIRVAAVEKKTAGVSDLKISHWFQTENTYGDTTAPSDDRAHEYELEYRLTAEKQISPKLSALMQLECMTYWDNDGWRAQRKDDGVYMRQGFIKYQPDAKTTFVGGKQAYWLAGGALADLDPSEDEIVPEGLIVGHQALLHHHQVEIPVAVEDFPDRHLAAAIFCHKALGDFISGLAERVVRRDVLEPRRHRVAVVGGVAGVEHDVGNLEVVRRDCAGNARKVVDDSVGFVVFQGVQHSVDVGSCLV